MGNSAWALGVKHIEGKDMPSFSSLHHALCHEKAARFVGLAMCMSNSQFPLFIPPSFDNLGLSSRRPCQSVSLSAILPAFENTSNPLEERTKNAPLR